MAKINFWSNDASVTQIKKGRDYLENSDTMKPLFIFFQSIKKLNETNTIYRNDQNQAYDERLNFSMLCIFHLLVSSIKGFSHTLQLIIVFTKVL